jgi:adenylosuccinate lyase
MLDFTHDTYLSAFTWRYGTPEMRAIWSEHNKRLTWRRIWVALATAQHTLGLVTSEQLADLQANMENIDIERALAIENEIRHDLMAEIRTYAEQCKVGGGIIHLGATSMDIVDNADVIRVSQSLELILAQLRELLLVLSDQIEEWSDVACMAYTHLQPAEPTTVGYRLAQYAQDLLMDYRELRFFRERLRGKGFKGAVGTSAAYVELFGFEDAQRMEFLAMHKLGLETFAATTQVYPRKQDYRILHAVAGLGASLHKATYDVRILQIPAFGEWSEPFASKQVGSSAMPFKRNPIMSENIGSLSRYLASLPQVAWDDAAGSLLERTLDDSANRRIILPSAFLCASEILRNALRLFSGLKFDHSAIIRNLEIYGPFAATERILMAGVRAGGDRQHLHEILRLHSLSAWERIRLGEPNPLAELLSQDETIRSLLPDVDLYDLLDAGTHVGYAPQNAMKVRNEILRVLG